MAQLQAMLAEEPQDVFLRYAIALEHKRLAEFDHAIDLLETLVREVPAHVASYYQLALLLADVGRTMEAIAACEAGILQCLVNSDRKARGELNELRNTLQEGSE